MGAEVKNELSARRVWLMLFAGPGLFLLTIIGVSVWLGLSGTDPAMIGVEAAGYAPQMLLAVLVAMAVMTLVFLPVPTLWTGPWSFSDIGIGALAGAVIAGLYFSILSPALVWLQTATGDIVPPGAVLATVSASLWVFFAANVLLAPLVEETVYRGLLLHWLIPRFHVVGGVVISCLVFGLLHWTGGIWYMVLTGTVAGGAFAGLAVWRGGLLAPFAAHLTLNVIEFVVTALP